MMHTTSPPQRAPRHDLNPQIVIAALLSAGLTASLSLYLADRHTAALVHDMTLVVHQAIVHTQQQDACDSGDSDDADCISDDDAPYDPPSTDA
jgi:hypothetical protein